MRPLLALLLPLSLVGADPDFTLMVLPDTQYQVFTCSPQVLNVMMNWIATNKNANLGNTDQGVNLTLNTKMVIGLGDISQQATSGEYARAAGSTTSGYGILDANGLPLVAPPGNHDWTDPTTVHTPFSAGFIAPASPSFANCTGVAGFFSATCRNLHGATQTGVSYGGKYDEANYYYKLVVGASKFLVFSVEYQPRAVVMAWVKTVQDANYGWSGIVATHSFHTHAVNDYGRFTDEPGYVSTGTSNNNDNGSANAGLKFSGTTSDDNFNSGYAMWNGYVGNNFTPAKNWAQQSVFIDGHWIAVEGTASTGYLATPNAYHYQTSTLSSTSSRGQTVQSIFTNWQDLESDSSGSEYPTWQTAGTAPVNVNGYCAGNNWAPFRLAHVMILQFRPSLGTVEGYIIGTTNAKWEPTFANRFAALGTTPIRLFSIPYAQAKRPIFPMGSAVGPQ